MAAVSGMRYAAGKKADGNKYEIRNVPYSHSTVWHVFGGAAYYQDSTHDKDCETQIFSSENKCEKCTINMLRLRLC